MPTLSEVRIYLTGLWLLIRQDPKGFHYLDLTERGSLRSFWAIAWSAPVIALSWIWWQMAYLKAFPPGAKTGLPFFLRLAMVELANWIVPLVLAGLLCMALGLGARFLAIVVASNWLAVPLSYIYGVIILLMMAVPGAEGIASLLWLVLMGVFVFVLARVIRMICGNQPLVISTLILVLIVPTMLLSDVLEQYLGVYPF